MDVTQDLHLRSIDAAHEKEPLRDCLQGSAVPLKKLAASVRGLCKLNVGCVPDVRIRQEVLSTVEGTEIQERVRPRETKRSYHGGGDGGRLVKIRSGRAACAMAHSAQQQF